MNGFHLASLTIQQALNVHETTRIVGDDVFSAGFKCRLAFDFAHGRRDHWELGREGATEAAADFGVFHFDEFQIFYFCEQSPRGLLVSQLAQAVATIVEGYFCWKAGTEV